MSNLSVDLLRESIALGPSSGAGETSSGHLLQRYHRLHIAAVLRHRLAGLLGRSRALLRLEDAAQGHVRGQRAAGTQIVPIRLIQGSEGRSADFDREFRPLSAKSWDRWRDVAVARQRGVTLPPVELIRVGAIYYVRDGHHRISVASAFGQRDVDAVVTVLDVT